MQMAESEQIRTHSGCLRPAFSSDCVKRHRDYFFTLTILHLDHRTAHQVDTDEQSFPSHLLTNCLQRVKRVLHYREILQRAGLPHIMSLPSDDQTSQQTVSALRF